MIDLLIILINDRSPNKPSIFTCRPVVGFGGFPRCFPRVPVGETPGGAPWAPTRLLGESLEDRLEAIQLRRWGQVEAALARDELSACARLAPTVAVGATNKGAQEPQTEK